MTSMDTTVRNLDAQAYRQLKAQAALQGMTLGEALNAAIRAWVTGSGSPARSRSLRDLRSQSWGPGTEKASEQVDQILFGVRS